MKNKIKVKQTILLVVEGEVEQIYFDSLRFECKKLPITVLPKLAKHSTPIQILETALKEQKKWAYDFIWCIFDYDMILTSKPKDFDKKLTQVKKAGIHIADSLPSFELWFLPHFTNVGFSSCNTNSVISLLKKHIHGYCKEQKWHIKQNLYEKLKPQLLIALKNAKSLENNVAQNKNNPYTNVYKLFETIQNIESLNI